MTQKLFAKMLMESIRNSEMDSKSEAEITAEVEILIGCLQPKNRDRFSQWGKPEERTTPEACWD